MPWKDAPTWKDRPRPCRHYCRKAHPYYHRLNGIRPKVSMGKPSSLWPNMDVTWFGGTWYRPRKRDTVKRDIGKATINVHWSAEGFFSIYFMPASGIPSAVLFIIGQVHPPISHTNRPIHAGLVRRSGQIHRILCNSTLFFNDVYVCKQLGLGYGGQPKQHQGCCGTLVQEENTGGDSVQLLIPDRA